MFAEDGVVGYEAFVAVDLFSGGEGDREDGGGGAVEFRTEED